MEELERAECWLPPEWQKALGGLSREVRGQIQEIRLRIGAPVTVSLPGESRFVLGTKCTGEHLVSMIQRLCGYSVHSHQQEIRNGFITAENGCRAGIAGTAVLEEGTIISIRDVTSICLRVGRMHVGCAKDIAFTVENGGGLHSILLCGEPASGKTSLLRDLVRELAEAGHRLSVVDERSELFPGGYTLCDVLKSYPKSIGIEQALRTLAPEGILFDEVGGAEAEAVLQCLNSGVAAITTLHADSIETLCRRPVAKKLLQSGAFDYVVLLRGRRYPGEVACILPKEELPL